MTDIELGEKISEDFFHGRSIDIAESLIGKFLVNSETGCGGVIIETEAYLGKADPSCHFAKSGEARKKVFRKGAGTVYVYIIHGHHCMNFISEYSGEPEGILIRAVKPVKGIEEMKDHRERGEIEELASGPGKLTEALGIKKNRHNGEKLSESSLKLYNTSLNLKAERSARIGIQEAEDWPARFLAPGSDFVSEGVKGCDRNFDFDEVYRELGER